MLAKIYRSSTLQGMRTDISNSVLGISNLSWKIAIDYAYVLPHPTLTVKPDLTVTKGDYIHIEFDSEIRFCTYITEIIEPADGETKTLQCWDIMKKLEDVPIKELTALGTWWSADTWWSGLSKEAKEELYLWDATAGDQSLKRYIAALFLIQVLMLEGCGIDMSAAQTSSMNTLDSIYEKWEDEAFVPVTNERIILQFRQAKAIAGTSYTQPAWEGGTALQVVQLLLRTLQIKFQYETVSLAVDYKLSAYGTPSIPTSDDAGYSVKDLVQYDGVSVKVNHFSDLYDYSAAWPEPDEEISNKPDDPSSGEKYKTIQLLDHFFLHYKETGTGSLLTLGLANHNFADQFAILMETQYTTEWQQKTFWQHIEEERDLLEITYDFKKHLCKMVYIDEVT